MHALVCVNVLTCWPPRSVHVPGCNRDEEEVSADLFPLLMSQTDNRGQIKWAISEGLFRDLEEEEEEEGGGSP